MMKPHRNQPLWYAYMLHRVSGVGLAVFLPFHFFVLGLALDNTDALNEVLHWTEQPLVKLTEFALVLFLAVHLFGGLRLLVLEFLPWRPVQNASSDKSREAAMHCAKLSLANRKQRASNLLSVKTMLSRTSCCRSPESVKYAAIAKIRPKSVCERGGSCAKSNEPPLAVDAFTIAASLKTSNFGAQCSA